MAKRAKEVDISEDLYCEVWTCKRQRVLTMCFTCIGCTIQHEAHATSVASSCCSGDNLNWTATRLGQFHAHLDSHRNRGDFVPEEYYELELN